MKRLSRRFFAGACVFIGLLGGRAAAQDEVPAAPDDPCAATVPGLTLASISTNDLTDADRDGLICVERESGDRSPITEEPRICRLVPANLQAAGVLSRLDIDGDDVADVSPDTDGDGLPDNWELCGVETSEVLEDRVVFFPAPSPIVPGTPPTPVFTRRAVATDALLADTDGDGLSDFIEVFGLMFIDDNRNGILDNGTEWMDFNGDGLPSPGEYPVDGTPGITAFGPDPEKPGEFVFVQLLHDFDGFVFTDPTNPDTDGDGIPDGADLDPLINPRAFGIAETIIVRFEAEGNPDIDQDGLGNGMDMGNDLLRSEAPDLGLFQVIDNPQNLRELLSLFREDLLAEGVVPESAIEDLLGADWDGNGLWRTTDVREWSLIIDPEDEDRRPPKEFFEVDGKRLFAAQKFSDDDLTDAERSAGHVALETVFNGPDFDRYGQRGIGLGWQQVLKPPSTTQFMPDKKVWAILYSWRMPGFDIDGDGFIGVPNLTATARNFDDESLAMVALHRDDPSDPYTLTNQVPRSSTDDSVQPFDDRIPIGLPEPTEPALNGVIEPPAGLTDVFRGLGCGASGPAMLLATALGLLVPLWWRRRG